MSSFAIQAEPEPPVSHQRGSLQSIYRACKRTDRTLLLDLYAMKVLRATGNPRVPAAGWPNLAVYVPEYQRRHIARTGRFNLVDRYRPGRIYREATSAFVGRAVMLFRPGMVRDIDLIPGAWEGARVIWSQWDGCLASAGRASGGLRWLARSR